MKNTLKSMGIILILSMIVLSGCGTKDITGNVVVEPKVEDKLDVVDVKSEKIILSDLESHNSESDCWVAYSGKVYDITEFLSKHKAPLGNYCGTSTEFEDAYMGTHKGGKDAILNEFEIGVLE